MLSAFLTHPDAAPSSAEAVALVEAAGGRASIEHSAPTTITLAIEGIARAAAIAALAPLEATCDIIVREGPPPVLLVADMDSTLVDCECLDELAAYAGLKAEVAAITERAMRGELDFAASLEARVALLAGLPEATIDACLAERVRPMPGAATLIATLRAHGIRTVMVTGGFEQFARPVARLLGIDRVVANRLEIDAGQLTGRVLPNIVGAETKREVLLTEAMPLGGAARAAAVGDGANDVPMLAAAGLGVAYRAKPAAAAAAHARVRHLTALLPAFGIARERWTILP